VRTFGTSTDGKECRLVNVEIFILLTFFESLLTRWKQTGFPLQTELAVWISLQENTTVSSQLQYGDIWTKQVSSAHAGECHQACHHLGHSALPLPILSPACCLNHIMLEGESVSSPSIFLIFTRQSSFPGEAQQSWQLSYFS